MGYKPHTRRNLAHKHRREIKSFRSVSSIQIDDHGDEWTVAHFEFETRLNYDAEEVYEKIIDYFVDEADPTSYSDLYGGETDGRRGTFTVTYPKR